jgi:hypothetical protein
MTTMLQFYNAQIPTSSPSYQFGLVRVSAEQPSWVPPDAGLVDHLFLLFGLVESLHPDFFADRVFSALAPGDYNADGAVNQADYTYWRSTIGLTNRLAADGNDNNQIDGADYVVWRKSLGAAGFESGNSVPEPKSVVLMLSLTAILLLQEASTGQNRSSCNPRQCIKGLVK